VAPVSPVLGTIAKLILVPRFFGFFTFSEAFLLELLLGAFKILSQALTALSPPV
jgi:hypothetical protein